MCVVCPLATTMMLFIEGSGADWIFCRCGQYLHEDCVEEVVKDSDGVDRLCSFCVDKYSGTVIMSYIFCLLT